MIEHLDLVVKLIVGFGTVGVTVWRVWVLTIKVRDMVRSIRENECRLNTLEQNILEKLESLQKVGFEAGKHVDKRFDAIEKRLSFLYGRTNITIPPKD